MAQYDYHNGIGFDQILVDSVLLAHVMTGVRISEQAALEGLYGAYRVRMLGSTENVDKIALEVWDDRAGLVSAAFGSEREDRRKVIDTVANLL